MSTQESGVISLPEVPLEAYGLLVQAQDFANATGKAVQIMLPDFKYGNTQSFEVTSGLA
ncbi:hypothetical protein [Mycobacteroides abscessus]